VEDLWRRVLADGGITACGVRLARLSPFRDVYDWDPSEFISAKDVKRPVQPFALVARPGRSTCGLDFAKEDSFRCQSR
jgi:hypothetical protein